MMDIVRQQTMGALAVAAAVEMMDPLPYGYPVNVPGVTCTVSPDDPDRARVTIDRHHMRWFIEIWADGWAPMRPATQTLIEQATDLAWHMRHCVEDEDLERPDVKRLVQQFTATDLWLAKSSPLWNKLPEDAVIHVETWFEELPGAL